MDGPDSGSPGVVDGLSLLVGELGSLPAAASDSERIERIGLLDAIKSAAAAAQAREISEFERSQLAEQRARGVPRRQLGRGIAEQIALARKVSPSTGSRQLTFATSLVRHMPATKALLAKGEISEWVAQIVVRETATLSAFDRTCVDAALAPDLPRMSPSQAEAATRREAIQRDPESAVRRGRTARSDRRVTLRPAPDTMALLSGFVPAEQGVAAWKSLDEHARSLRSQGDPRSLGQIMADTLVERVTGQTAALAVPVEIGLTMPTDALLDDDEAPAVLDGYGPIPAEFARDLTALESARTFIRRIFTDPISERAVAVDPRRRLFPSSLKRVIATRDQTCRTPYCTAPIRHSDHIEPHRRGGPTSLTNGQGLCERCSYVKEMPGWRAHTDNSGHTVTTTPTGRTYVSGSPPVSGPGPTRDEGHRRIAIRRLERLRRARVIASLPPPDDPDP
jgi:hypothetical protein